MSHKAYLVDGSGYIFRAFYAVAPLSTKDGFPTNALFGFARMLLKLLAASDSDHVVVVFDAGKKTFRTELYDQYKANRIELPEDLRKQMPYFREICSALGLLILEKPGYEADDIIGTLSDKLSRGGSEVVVVSGDKDLMQLVNPQVSIWDTMYDRRYSAPQVIEKFGVPPEKVVEFLGLTGDSSDNIPGLKGCGPKTAVQLLERFGDVASVVKNADVIANDATIRNRKKLAEQIKADAELVLLSRKLVEIDRKVPIDIPRNGSTASLDSLDGDVLLEKLCRHDPDEAKIRELVEKFEFSSLLKDLKLGVRAAQPETPTDISYACVWADDFAGFVKSLKEQKEFAFDLETTSLDLFQAKIVGASFSWSDKGAFYIPIAHVQVPEGKEQVKYADFISGLKGVFADPKVKKFGQNLKYDISILAQHEAPVEGVAFDTMIASYLLNPDKGAHNLTALAQDYLGKPVIEYTDLVEGKENFSEVPIDAATTYGCQDAHFAWMLKGVLEPLLKKNALLEIFETIEVPLIPVLSRMERRGIKLDVELISNMSDDFGVKLKAMEKNLYELAGVEFNLNSPKQLADVLFNKLGLPTKGVKKTKTGLSTDSSVLEKLSGVHPLPDLILQYRMIYKLKSTYLDALREQVSPITGRLHTRFNQTITGTGRLSSSDPNLQNIPIQTEEGRRIRTGFVADARNSLLSADYSQIELRVLAHMSNDANLISAFKAGEDVHAKTAREIMGLAPSEEISSEIRRIGKTINFGVVYGMGAFRLARELAIPVRVAQSYIDNYFSRYSGVKEYFARLEHDVSSQGFVTTLFGRKRFASDIDSSNRDQGFVLRAALNAPIQGTAADLIKLAMIRIDKRIRTEELPVAMLLQIHDELVFECPEDICESVMTLVRNEMENVVQFSVPLVVDIGSGKNWQEAHA
jgi:DNA polymerase-1